MSIVAEEGIASAIGRLPYRMALAGGWIDQPFVSRHNPEAPGSMVVVGLQPAMRFMDRCGMGTSTRSVAHRLWGETLPDAAPEKLVRTLYDAENRGRTDPSGSQDMIGLVYPGINRLDYDVKHEGGFFPVHIESSNEPEIARWLENVIHVVPVAPRPDGYSPLGIRVLDPAWIARLGCSGRNCFAAIVARSAQSLGESFNESMACWEAILPATVRHPTLRVDLIAILQHYQARYIGAMYSGCGGGYLYVVSEAPVPGSFHVRIRTTPTDAVP